MFNHMTLGSDDLVRSRRFYDAVLGALGIAPAVEDGQGRLVYRHDGAGLLLTRPIDGGGAAPGNGGTVGFKAASAEAVDAWHKAGVENGGRSIEEPPGLRDGGRLGPLYLAYLRDPDGNKLCALHRPGPTAA